MKKVNCRYKLMWVLFGQLLKHLGFFFTLTSGRTVDNSSTKNELKITSKTTMNASLAAKT